MKSTIDAILGFGMLGAMCFATLVAGVGVIAIARAMAIRAATARRLQREALVKKWGPQVAEWINARRFGVDMPAEALRQSLGPPLDIDQKVTKTKRVETWKYARDGRRGYRLKITVEYGKVTGWDDRR